jgi:uncharacterized membrane protein (UPF0127 family)
MTSIMKANNYKRLLLLCLLGLLTGCEHSPAGLAMVKMQIGKRTFTLEVADTEATREHGLMERDSMPSDHGMIFIFAQEEPLSFWMKNTRFPLDILYVDAAGKVVSIHQMRAYDLSTTPSDFPAKYAIELNLGAANAAEVHVGEKLNIPQPAKEPKGGG